MFKGIDHLTISLGAFALSLALFAIAFAHEAGRREAAEALCGATAEEVPVEELARNSFKGAFLE